MIITSLEMGLSNALVATVLAVWRSRFRAPPAAALGTGRVVAGARQVAHPADLDSAARLDPLAAASAECVAADRFTRRCQSRLADSADRELARIVRR